MKTFFASFVLLLVITGSLKAQSEKYNVLNVVGQIKIKSSGKVVAKGDVLSSEDQVVFASGTAMAAVFSPSKGRFTLKPKADQKAGNEFLAYVKSSIVPATQVLAARDVDPSYKAPDKHDEVCGGKFLVLPGTAVEVSEAFPVDADHFFFIRMEWLGEEVSKKLIPVEGLLPFNPQEILVVDAKPIPAQEVSNFRLYYYDAAAKNSTLVCGMSPVFPVEAALVEEAKILVEADRASMISEANVRADVKGYLIDYYGTPTDAAFQAWFDTHFKL